MRAQKGAKKAKKGADSQLQEHTSEQPHEEQTSVATEPEGGSTSGEQAAAQPQADEIFDPEKADRDTLLQKYLELERRLRQEQERVLRIAAEAENYKKRMQREKEEHAKFANEKLIRSLLPVIDNLERALEHADPSANQQGLVEGLKMTIQGFLDTLTKFGCKPVEAEGEIFDPNLHEAVSSEVRDDVAANTVVRQLQKGYLLHDRLLRPAMVVVGATPSEGGGRAETESARQV